MRVKNELLEVLFQTIVNHDWSIDVEGENDYRLGKYSPAGQDFSIIVEGEEVDEIIESIYQAYENYDVSEETYLWLDNTGHGVNGAPYEMRDVLEDMEACEQMILDLYNTLKSFDFYWCLYKLNILLKDSRNGFMSKTF